MLGDFIALLLADADVTAAFGSRIRPTSRDQTDGLPAATVNVISRGDDLTNDGASGYVVSRVQLDVYAMSYGEAEAAASAVRRRLNGFRGVQGATVFQGVMLDGERTGFDMGDAARDRLARVSLDFMVHYGAAA